MRRKYTSEEQTEDINITPMLDIVFILLIFFIVTSTFVEETGVDIERATASTATTSDKSPIMIAISAEGTVWMNQVPISVQHIQLQLNKNAVAKTSSVMIMADKSSESGFLVKVMDEVKQYGIEKIAIAAKSEKH
jgi:biopolymer transport protein ExbD